ncbi:RHS repeat domain-containing protein [Prolixibacter sp. NT017]|uniref:RHS repeat domain-containing protein n=1 Tax=Prolixibacter sp. NT017 TaxID=2652390 RepID=UPI00127E9E5C|nr:RHS repeat-associated core domain-containing protein [Prolixibacter sp. NT017]GET24713.1 hypothetical protein NT017_10420 [Prolixibacter sp. NT017]
MSPVVYDKNGNIRNLTRKNSSGGNRESLGYTYAGNRLSHISGTYNGIYKSGTFIYDGNGNATSDGLRGLTVTYFDELNLPKQYYQNSTNKVDYTYDAGGNKWSKTATVSGTASTTLYDGTFIYENGTLKKVLTSEGYYDPSAGLYYYYLKDHLGNTRLTFHYSGTTAVVDQEVEYYPFGSLFTENNLDKNKYLYNGKELNDEFFENYDYGARFYDAELGRFHTIDPLAEKYSFQSSYLYGCDNPIRFIDYMGMNGQEPDDDKEPSVFSISDWINSMANALGFNMKNMSRANTSEEMDQIAQHNEQQSANLEKTDSGVKLATVVATTIVSAPLVVAASPELAPATIFSTEGAFLKGAISTGVQVIANDGKIDPLTVATDAFLTPGVGSVIDAAIDVKVQPGTGVSIDVVGLNKTPERAALDFVAGYGFGIAKNKATGVMLRNSETEAQKYFYEIMTGTTIGVAGTKIKE